MISMPARGTTVPAICIEAAPDLRHGSEAALGAADVGEEAVRDALRRILDSPNFEVTERNRRFLSYVVEETLAGRANRIKGYTIAVDVFNRDRSFDAVSDPMIRIQASRLRRGLEHYYLTAGSDDPVRMTIPIGRYVPRFLAVQAPQAPQAEAEPDPGRESLGRRLPVHLKAVAVGSALVLVLAAGLWLRPHATPGGPAEHVTAQGDRASVPV